MREVRQLIYKQSTGKIHAVFTSVVFLSQIVLSVMDASSAAVAGQLVECYMSLFERALQQGEMGSRLLAALLTGVNKALPYLRSIEPIVQHVDALFQMVFKILPTNHNHLIVILLCCSLLSHSVIIIYTVIYGRIYRSIRRLSLRPFSRWLCCPTLLWTRTSVRTPRRRWTYRRDTTGPSVASCSRVTFGQLFRIISNYNCLPNFQVII